MRTKTDYKTKCDHVFMIKKGEFEGKTTIEGFQILDGHEIWVGRQSFENLKIKEALNV